MEILAENATTQCFIFNTANDDDNGEREREKLTHLVQ